MTDPFEVQDQPVRDWVKNPPSDDEVREIDRWVGYVYEAGGLPEESPGWLHEVFAPDGGTLLFWSWFTACRDGQGFDGEKPRPTDAMIARWGDSLVIAGRTEFAADVLTALTSERARADAWQARALLNEDKWLRECGRTATLKELSARCQEAHADELARADRAEAVEP
jgi:hypothetical protein